MDYVLENCTLDPFSYETDFTELIGESVWYDEFYAEAAEETKKKNIFQKLWDLLKRLFNIISLKVKQIGASIKAFFGKKGGKVNDKTLDEIAEYVLGEVEDTPASKHLKFTYENGNTIKINYMKNMNKLTKGNDIRLLGTDKEIVKDPRSKAKRPEIDSGHKYSERPEQNDIVYIMHVIKKPQILDPIISMVRDIVQNNGKINFSLKEAQAAVDSFYIGTSLGLSCTITLEQWSILNERVIEFNKLMQMIDDDTMGAVQLTDKNGKDVKASVLKIINEFVRICKNLQLGINYIGDGMRQVYKLDPKYEDKINAENFREKLPLFVKMCVESNIPSKYVVYATRQICDTSLNAEIGNPNKKPDLNGQMSGNGRFVMFPGADSLKSKVIKIGYNGLGARGNRNEFMVWNRVKGIDEIAKQLYHVEGIGDSSNYVILCDRAKPIDKYSKTEEWCEQMKELCIKYDVGFIIRCNDGAFAEGPNGQPICIDYGTVHRWDRYADDIKKYHSKHPEWREDSVREHPEKFGGKNEEATNNTPPAENSNESSNEEGQQ